MIDQTVKSFLDALAERSPTPGGGAGAGLAAASGASLLLMVLRYCHGKKAMAGREAALAAAEAAVLDARERLLPMAARDAAAFELVARAYDLPKDTPDAEARRTRAIQEGLVGAMVVPEETLCLVRDALVAVAPVVEGIGKAIIADLGTGCALLEAAAEGCRMNLRVNAAYLQDKHRAAAALERMRAVFREISAALDTARERVDALI